MGKGSKHGGKSAKEERRANKAEQNRSREKGRQQRRLLDDKEIKSFAQMLLLEGYELKEVERDGNCFFRSLADQLDGREHGHDAYRQRVMDYVEKHEDDFVPFMSFGESEEEEDSNFAAYVGRLRSDGEWAGQVELTAAAQALGVHIVVHQHEHPSYRIECRSDAGDAKRSKGAAVKLPVVHLSYHDGEHYNSVHPMGGRSARACGGSCSSAERETKDRAHGKDAPAAADNTGTGDEAEVSALLRGVVSVKIDPSSGAAVEERLSSSWTTGDGDDDNDDDDDLNSSHSGGSSTQQQRAAKEPEQKLKMKRKEEKRLRKEQKHRESIQVAADSSASTDHDSVITL